jgi:hypothetical protein
VVNILRFCVGLHAVNKPLWLRTTECEAFFSACGSFATVMMRLESKGKWYPTTSLLGNSGKGKKKGRKGKRQKTDL